MNIKLIISIFIVGLLGFGVSYGINLYSHQDDGHGYINPLLKDNKAAQEISALGIEVDIEDLGCDNNGYVVRGQTRFYILEDGSEQIVEVVLDDDINPNSYEAHAILYHELGHVVLVGDDDNEANADAYALSRGYEIHDAYSGQH